MFRGLTFLTAKGVFPGTDRQTGRQVGRGKGREASASEPPRENGSEEGDRGREAHSHRLIWRIIEADGWSQNKRINPLSTGDIVRAVMDGILFIDTLSALGLNSIESQQIFQQDFQQSF